MIKEVVMQIENGRFYFINSDFMRKYGAKYNLMENKESETKRPYANTICLF